MDRNKSILNLFENLFETIKVIINWILSEGFMNIKKGGIISVIALILGGIIVNSTNNFTIKIITISIASCIIIVIMYIGYIMFDESKILKFIYKKYKKPYEILNEFTHTSYLYGLTIFSFMTWFCMLGIIVYGSGMSIKISYNIMVNLLLCIMSIFTIMWFVYHLIYNSNITIKIIKVRLNLYMAIATTLSTIIIWPLFQESLKSVITCLGVSYVWLSYLIEKAELEYKEK